MDFSKLDGLIPAVIQDAQSAEVLMVGFMNEEALALTRNLWETISTPQNFPMTNDASGSLTFDFPTAPNSMGYIYSTRPPSAIAGQVVVSFQVTATGAPVFNYASPDNTCVVPAKVRPSASSAVRIASRGAAYLAAS